MPTRGKRRALGQHFLRDESIARLIAERAVDEAERSGCVQLLEIGPGKGAITFPLIERLKKSPGISLFRVAEKDRDLASFWRVQQALGSRLEVLEGDFLEQPESAWLPDDPLAIASNLPYSAGTAILIRLASHPERIPVMVLMFQAEVAMRLRAQPSSKDWGSLSVWIQNRWEVSKLVSVRPGAFQPPPEVESEVVILKRRQTPFVDVPRTPKAERLWEALLKVCFAHRRKMLRSGLPKSGIWRNALEVSGVDGTKRAEALAWNDWRHLYEACLRLSPADGPSFSP